MLPSVDVHRHLLGVWHMMTGRREGIKLLDISVDGFWNSFYAIIVALPVMLAGWASLAVELSPADSSAAGRFGLVLRMALVDLSAWILPLIGLALVANLIGIRDRFIHYVVATNWGTALFAWFMLPTNLLRLFWPGGEDLAVTLALMIFLASLVLSWRLTNSALAKGPAVASGVFAAMLLASMMVLFGFQDLLGVPPIQ
ncbi:transporter [Aquamicrobium zhengzhouense]|uniref:Transporter n=1 Tax=Aquamicrobium zhengzhouense TaxID=2781738 RepID=A0ABS0SC70_9HYPH|nr:transporter [Aquamicrobium zhengzhouense]MBI1620895.1 transporter [Aquamicrobium zhengzhouense]